MSFHTFINENHPIRKTEEQKKAFRQWALNQAASLGYSARVESVGKKEQHRNVIIGDPAEAKVLFTAHYDTPARSLFPNLMMPRNVVMFFLYQFLIIGVFVLLSVAVGVAAGLLTGEPQVAILAAYVVYFGLLLMMRMGPANKHNANDNTSGVAAVFALMEKLPPAVRERAAFILFDNEEKGLQGSKAYAKKHEQQAYLSLAVNLDCVGVGETVLMVVNKLARQLPAVDLLEKTMQQTPGRAYRMFRSISGLLNSDHKAFKRGVMVCACKENKLLGYYTPHIHTRKDTEADPANIAYLAEGLSAFVAALPEEEA